MQLTKPVDWISETKFVVDGLEFVGDLQSYAERTTRDRVVILKYSSLMKQYMDFLAGHQIDNMFELGIWQGGSPLFYAMATDAKKVVALDLAPKNPALDEIVAQHGLGDKLKMHFEISQDNHWAVQQLMDAEFGDEKLDLVIDDASHLYWPSRTSFEIIFPRLREGGLYIIEDWQWAHIDDPQYQNGTTFGDQPALTNFIFELLMAYGSHPDLFWNIVVRDWFVAVQKGSKPLPPDFTLQSVIRARGKSLTLI
jgi:predicted O-methyltransferase YrrM